VGSFDFGQFLCRSELFLHFSILEEPLSAKASVDILLLSDMN
jgi:hypothetical protein